MGSDQNNLFNQLNNRDSTYSVEDIIEFAHTLDDKYAEQKEFIRRLQSSGQFILNSKGRVVMIIWFELLKLKMHLLS